ncbi:MAG: tetratricopeptide repeat protein, partial [Candidatus Zixiibacteriota bacterium]
STIDKLDSKAYDNYVNGVIAEQARDYLSAAKFYNAALQRYPDSYEIRLSLAEVYYRLQRFRDALKTLNSITPADIDVYSLRAICYRSVGENNAARDAYLKVVQTDTLNINGFSFLASEYRRMNMRDSLEWTYKHLVQIENESPQFWGEYGQILSQQSKYAEAKAALQRSLELSRGRENLTSFVGLAEAFRALNQPDSASILYQEALKLDPNNSYLNRALAAHYADLDSTALALQYAEKLTRLEPNNISAHRYLALMYVRADSLFQAEGLFRSLINAGDQEPANFFYLGRIAIMKQDYETARENLTILTTMADSLVDGWVDLGYVYRMMNDTVKSINVYNSGLKFVKNEADSVRLMFAIGSTLERFKRYGQSEETFEKLLKLDPEHSQSLNYLGYMLADQNKRLNYAHDLVKKALDLAPQNAAYIDSYGWVMYRLGKFDSAVEYLEKAVALERDPIIFDHLGDAYKALGKTDDARIWWQRALELEPTNDTIREKLNE